MGDQAAVKDWFTKYEMLTDMVVPQSSKKIFEDNEHSLVTVTMFHKVVDEFKHHARYSMITIYSSRSMWYFCCHGNEKLFF